MKQIIERINQVVTMSSKLVRSGGPVIRGNIVGRIRRMEREIERRNVGGDEGIGCETMRCYADDGSIQCKDVGGKEQALTRKVLTNFLAREEEQPLER